MALLIKLGLPSYALYYFNNLLLIPKCFVISWKDWVLIRLINNCRMSSSSDSIEKQNLDLPEIVDCPHNLKFLSKFLWSLQIVYILNLFYMEELLINILNRISLRLLSWGIIDVNMNISDSSTSAWCNAQLINQHTQIKLIKCLCTLCHCIHTDFAFTW